MKRQPQAASAGKQRHLRVGEGLRRALSEILARGGLRDPDLDGVNITVSEVRVSPDLRNATAFVLPLGGGASDRIEAALARSTPYLRGMLAQRVRLKYMPSLSFRIDRSFDAAAHMDDLLRGLDIPDEGGDGT